jgi:hypothetical protein
MATLNRKSNLAGKSPRITAGADGTLIMNLTRRLGNGTCENEPRKRRRTSGSSAYEGRWASMNTRRLCLALMFCSACSLALRAASIVEHEITCKPAFVRHGASVCVLLQNATIRLESMWYGSDFFFGRFKLNTNQVYSFTVLEGLDMSPAGPRIVRVRKGTETIHDATVCKFHQTKMILKPQRFVLGWAPRRPPQADERRFPNRPRVFYDCVFHPNRPQTLLMYECAECNTAYEKWKA